MKKSRSLFSLVILSSLLSAFFVGSVAASDKFILTSTPTRNPKTPPSTPTSGGAFEIGQGNGSDTFQCPPGGVEGYGEVTPDAMWMALCGQCIPTGTPYPTFDFDDFPTRTQVVWVSGTPATLDPFIELTYTPVYTATSYASVTPFATGTLTSIPSCSAGSLTYSGGSFTYPTHWATEFISSSLVCEQIGSSSVWCHGQVVYKDLHGTGDAGGMLVDVPISTIPVASTIYMQVRSMAAGGMVWSAHPSLNGLYGQVSSTVEGCSYLSPSWWNDGLYSCSNNGAAATKLRIGIYCSGSLNGLCTNNIDITFSRGNDSSCLSTPIPVSVTPTVGMNYCSSINNGMGDLSDQDMSFWQPAGPPACMVIPAFDTNELFGIYAFLDWLISFTGVPLLFQRAIDLVTASIVVFGVETPAMTLCLQPYDFAPVYLFGNILLVQTVVDIGIGLYLVQILRKR